MVEGCLRCVWVQVKEQVIPERESGEGQRRRHVKPLELTEWTAWGKQGAEFLQVGELDPNPDVHGNAYGLYRTTPQTGALVASCPSHTHSRIAAGHPMPGATATQ